MIHGVYVKNRPKSKWHLVTAVVSPELANRELQEALQQAQREGNEQAEVAIQLFESSFFIPETLPEIKKHTPQFN